MVLPGSAGFYTVLQNPAEPRRTQRNPAEPDYFLLNFSVVTTLGHSPLPQISVSPTTSVPSGSTDQRKMFDSHRWPSCGVVSVLISSVSRLKVARDTRTSFWPLTTYSLRLSAPKVNRASRCGGGLTRAITNVVPVCVTMASVPNQN